MGVAKSEDPEQTVPEVVKLETSQQEADVVPEEQSDVAKDDTK